MFILEFRAVREEHEFFEVCRTPELACEVTMQVYYAMALTPQLNHKFIWIIWYHNSFSLDELW